MLWKTHLAFAFLLILLGKIIFEIDITIILILLVIFGALFPDLDEKNSKLGRKAKIIGFIFDHRGFLHTIWALIIFSIIIREILGELEAYFFAASYASHLVMDAITKKGIVPFHPLKLKIKGNIRSGGFFEKIIFLLTCFLIFLLVLYFYLNNQIVYF